MAAQFLPLLLVTFFSSCIIADSTNIYGPATADTSRYWDCCKPSCAWSGKASFNTPVLTCSAQGKTLFDASQGSGCNGGPSFACANNSPWAVNDTFSYGFAGAYLMGGDETTWCCSCYQLTFTSGPVKGKSMIVQASNTDYDTISNNTFTFSIPGGNTSYAGACAVQYSVPNSTFGAQNVGLTTSADCANLPAALRPGCYWRFSWFQDAQAPTIEYTRVQCPAALTNITGCIRTDETTFETAAAKNASSSANAANVLAPSMPYSIAFGLFVFWILQLLS